MNRKELAAFLALLMCSEPWPVVDKSGNDPRGTQKILENLAEKESRKFGYANWVEAYHAF